MKTQTEPAIVADAAAPRATVKEAARRRVRSTDLFGDGREVQIEHAGELYFLRQTSKGKLILTK